VIKYLMAFAIVGAAGSRIAPAQQPACLHGPSETSAQTGRRQAAVSFARQVNTTQAAARRQAQTYYALSDLHAGVPPVPDGFKAQLSTDGVSYVFSIKDTLDPCQWALFSDQEGVIYTAAPLR
jgi:hypothetical protein